MSELPLFGSRLTCGCQIMLVKRLSDQGLYYCLAADVQFFCRVVQFVEHWRREVYIHPLDRTHRSEEHTSELQSLRHLVCRLLPGERNPHQTITAAPAPP